MAELNRPRLCNLGHHLPHGRGDFRLEPSPYVKQAALFLFSFFLPSFPFLSFSLSSRIVACKILYASSSEMVHCTYTQYCGDGLTFGRSIPPPRTLALLLPHFVFSSFLHFLFLCCIFLYLLWALCTSTSVLVTWNRSCERRAGDEGQRSKRKHHGVLALASVRLTFRNQELKVERANR